MGADIEREVNNLTNGLPKALIRVQLENVLASPMFARANRMRSLLRYVVEETLQGRADDLKEYNLALAVFHRDETFDPSTNALVRIGAGRLRNMLATYYLTEGRADPIIMDIPVGCYIPRFWALKPQISIFDSFDAQPEAASAKHPAVPDKPSIAVLAFDNMSDDPGQEYFADGIADDIITGLSRYRSLFVIARNSSFSYKGKAVDVKQIAAEQGVRYVLEGCVHRQSCSVRVSARLINTNSGNCIWSDQYEGALEDVLLLQDQFSKLIVNAIEHEITSAEYERAQQQRPDGHTAWDFYLRGIWVGNRGLSEDQNIALEHMRSAVRADPNFSPAYSYLSWRLSWMTGTGICAHKDEVFREAIALGEKAIELDNGDAQAYFALGNVLTRTGRMDEGANLCRISIELNPNYAKGHYGLSYAMNWQGEHKRALEHAEMAIRLSPKDPNLWYIIIHKSMILRRLGQFEDAAVVGREAVYYPGSGHYAHMNQAVNLAMAEHVEEARWHGRKALELRPCLNVASMLERYSYFPKEGLQIMAEGMIKAGIPAK